MSKTSKTILPKTTRSKTHASTGDILAEIKKMRGDIAGLKEQISALVSQILPPKPMTRPKIDPAGGC